MKELEKAYVGSKDLEALGLTIYEARKVISAVQKIMIEKGMYIPKTKSKLAYTKLVRKYLKI